MHSVLAIVFAVLVAFLIAAGLRRIRREQFLTARLDTVCGPAGLEVAESTGARLLPLAGILSLPGLIPDSPAGRTYALLASGGLLLLTVLLGWKIGLAATAFVALTHVVLLRWRRKKEEQEFADGLPALLERTRRLILIGNSLPQAFMEAVSTSEGVVKRELDPVARRVRHGASFTESIDMLARQVDIIELHMLAAYVRTNAKFGGRVAQTLVNLINQLGNKRRLEREIKAATAETRASAAILFGLMALTMVVMAVMNPEYIGFYLDSNTGLLILAGILAWPLLGVLVMRRILVLDY